MDRLTIFWITVAVALVLAGIGLWINLSIWLQGQVNGKDGPVTQQTK
ncbi:MAG: hypothetical protein ACE5NP_00210 [Anaerolineae bacterium]